MSPLTNQPPYNIARFSGFFIESLLTGVYWVHFYLYVEGVYVRSRMFRTRAFLPMFGLGLLVFLVLMGHFLVLVISSFIALSNMTETDTPMERRGYLALNPNWNVAYNAFFVCVPFLADSFLICRLYVVWAGNWWITIPPVAFCVSLLVTASVATARSVGSVGSGFQDSSEWIIASFALTFVCNTYFTFFIALRVVLAQRRNNQLGMASFRSRIEPWIDVLVKSAALYCFLIMLCLIFAVIQSNALYMTIAATAPVVGISFCMIVSRADSEKETDLRNAINQFQSMGAPMFPIPDVVLASDTVMETTRRNARDNLNDEGSTLRDSDVTTNFTPLAEKILDPDITTAEP